MDRRKLNREDANFVENHQNRHSGIRLAGYPSMRDSEVDPQMMNSGYSMWYLDFGTQKERTLF